MPATVPSVPTRTQRRVLTCLAAGWVMDRDGKAGLGAVVFNSRQDKPLQLRANTVSDLLAEGWIVATRNDITDYRITAAGQAAIA
jgi:hypothetical protein